MPPCISCTPVIFTNTRLRSSRPASALAAAMLCAMWAWITA